MLAERGGGGKEKERELSLENMIQDMKNIQSSEVIAVDL